MYFIIRCIIAYWRLCVWRFYTATYSYAFILQHWYMTIHLSYLIRIYFIVEFLQRGTQLLKLLK